MEHESVEVSSLRQRATEAATWPASLHLRFSGDAAAARLAFCQHHGPLRVQRAFYPEGPSVPHVYMLHPPGGLAGGDELSITIDVDRGAHALLTTPAAGKCYRSDGRTARQVHRLRVAAGSTLEWLPQENIVFDGAEVRLETHVELDPQARFIGWDILCLGRPANRERFTRGSCRQKFELFAATRPLFIERASYDGGAPVLDASYGLAGMPASGTMVAWPATRAMLDVARAASVCGERDLVTATLLDESGALCVRYLGSSAGRARERFAQVWSEIRPLLLGKPAVFPRIWST